MPMPASTFTLAVGHWHQVSAEIPPVLESVRDRADWSKTANLKAGPEARLVSGSGSSTNEVVKGSPFQTGRYFVIFPVLFSSPHC